MAIFNGLLMVGYKVMLRVYLAVYCLSQWDANLYRGSADVLFRTWFVRGAECPLGTADLGNQTDKRS